MVLDGGHTVGTKLASRSRRSNPPASRCGRCYVEGNARVNSARTRIGGGHGRQILATRLHGMSMPSVDAGNHARFASPGRRRTRYAGTGSGEAVNRRSKPIPYGVRRSLSPLSWSIGPSVLSVASCAEYLCSARLSRKNRFGIRLSVHKEGCEVNGLLTDLKFARGPKWLPSRGRARGGSRPSSVSS